MEQSSRDTRQLNRNAVIAPFSYERLDDDALVELALDQDEKAFTTLTERYVRMIIAMAYHRTSDMSTAEDMAQETFIEAHRQLSTIREGSKFRSWLTTIAVNKVNAHHRTIGRRRQHFQRVTLDNEQLEQVLDSNPNPHEQAHGSMVTGQIMEAIAKLESKLGDVVYMKLIEELSSSEIANRLNINESTARMRLKRGLAKVRESLERQGLR